MADDKEQQSNKAMKEMVNLSFDLTYNDACKVETHVRNLRKQLEDQLPKAQRPKNHFGF